MKRKQILIGVLTIAIGMTGCQQNPKSSIVKNKNMEQLIEEAKMGEGEDVADMKKYDSYQAEFEDKKLGVTVKADAKVDIPTVQELSVYRVRQKPITQEFLDKVRQTLLKDETLYDGSILEKKTRKSIEDEIKSWKNEVKNSGLTGEALKEYEAEVQGEIDKLQEEYEKAPAGLVYEGNESDGKIHTVAEILKKDKNNVFYNWEKDLNPNGEVYYGITDGKDNNYASLFVQNNEEYGNCIRYYTGKHGYEYVTSAVVEGTDIEFMETQLEESGKDYEFQDEAATMSLGEARTIAEDFLKEVGLDAFAFNDGKMFKEMADIREKVGKQEISGYRNTYFLRYMRNMDGALVTFDTLSKTSYEGEGAGFTKKSWPVECVEFRINDNGIVGFSYNAPIEITETVVEKTALKSFEEMKTTFEKMAVIKNATKATDGTIQKHITVDRVILGYARISEADRFDTGLLVPVWDFKGSIDYENRSKEYGSILTVNAIDGSVVDRTLGY